MPDWLIDSLSAASDGYAIELTIRLAVAFLCGCVIAAIYWGVRTREEFIPTFPATLVVLAILCAMLPLVIGQNVAWAFGLVGALSIVRFRTVVDDTLDITFVIFAVLVGMAVGADQLTVALVGMSVTGTATFLLRPRKNASRWSSGRDAKLRIQLGVGRDPEIVFQDVFSNLLNKVDLSAGATSKQGASLDLTYRIRMNAQCKPTDLINELNLIDGVESVELRRGR